MRKVQIIAIPLLIALFVLGACAPTAPPTPPTPPTPPPGGEEELAPPTGEEEEAAPPTPSKPHFTSDDGRIEFALDSVERTKVWPAELQDGGTPKQGYDFVIVDVTIVRITDGHIDMRKGYTIIDNNGVEYDASSWSWEKVKFYDPTDIDSETELLEGSKVKLIFEIPENVKAVRLKLAYVFFKSWSESGQHESEEERYIDIILS